MEKKNKNIQIVELGIKSYTDALLMQEKYFNEIYLKETCVSPLKSLSLHLTNINSSYGLSPLIDYKKLWEENEIND